MVLAESSLRYVSLARDVGTGKGSYSLLQQLQTHPIINDDSNARRIALFSSG